MRQALLVIPECCAFRCRIKQNKPCRNDISSAVQKAIHNTNAIRTACFVLGFPPYAARCSAEIASGSLGERVRDNMRAAFTTPKVEVFALSQQVDLTNKPFKILLGIGREHRHDVCLVFVKLFKGRTWQFVFFSLAFRSVQSSALCR